MILARWWARRSLYAKGSVVVAIPLVAILPMVPFFLSALGTARLAGEHERRLTTTIQAASAVLGDIVQAEAGVRGFLLTGDAEFLEPYETALERLPAERAALEEAAGPGAATVIASLDLVVEPRIGLLTSMVEDPRTATDRALETGRGLTERIRWLIGSIQRAVDAERTIVEADRDAAERRAATAVRIAVPVAVVGGALGLLLFAHGIAARIRRNTVNAERLVVGNELLPPPEGHDEIGRSGAALVEAGRLLRERESALRASERELRTILENLREGVALTDADGRVIRINHAAADIAGFDVRMRDEAGWRRRYEVFTEALEPVDVEDLPSRRATRGLSTEPTILRIRDRETGIVRWVMSYGAPAIAEDGSVVGGVTGISDVTDRFEAQASLARAHAELERSNAELRDAHERLEALAVTDRLTGLLNRHGFEPLAQQQLELAKRAGDEVALLFFDVDGLKRVNDELGHTVGSQLLVAAAAAIRSSLRAADLCVRLGGDEFCALMTGGPDTIEHVRERIDLRIAETNASPGLPFRLSMSVGAASSTPRAPMTLDELLTVADARMYEDKRRRAAQRVVV
ncbi:MAG TPA: diguanylate cyclase [Actinomycetota bacterium]|nr:diguanylate cyclase [Actinomycetota bacterium]